ncbi:Acetoin utilization protein AcuC [Seminavis robusta]|uniref:Acetoin utilization protein AcuC n=1 Tax=Seminavis robusta TaxID=568900 RepID=A0A9N8EH27_9STRA|nr:Acetoin utilization protein AcuC [Seminavis robusta]|eukprot:Sro1153_g247010.1 Acetoin utilization protein AcuC (426) ;mRNA; r:15105-16471
MVRTQQRKPIIHLVSMPMILLVSSQLKSAIGMIQPACYTRTGKQAVRSFTVNNLSRTLQSSRGSIGSRWMSASSSAAEVEDATTSIKHKSSIPAFRIFYNDVYEVHLPKGHRFPMDKYQRVRKQVQKVVKELPKEEQEKVDCDFHVSPLATVDELVTTHSYEYVQKVLSGDLTEQELRNVGFPWNEENVKRSFSSVGGTVAAAKFVCEAAEQRKDNPSSIPPWAAHVAGGTHHAFHDRGEGFCVFSDIAVAANVALQSFPNIERILILDLDVHQGNGNAVLFQGRPEVVTFSMQCVANYFSEKQQSDLDVELPPDCTDQTYLMTLSHWLKRIKRESGPYDLVFFQAGVDILAEDRLGRMSISQKGVETRNKLVFDFAMDLNVPLVITMGGGYPRTDDWAPILQAHSNVYLQARQYLADTGASRKQ